MSMVNKYLLVLVFFLKSLTSFGQQDTIELYIPDTSILVGNAAKVEVRVNGFIDIISMQASINWDPALISFIDVSDFGLSYLGADDFGTTKTDEGHLRFVWTPGDAQARSLPDSSLLFTINFECLGIEPFEVTLDYEDKLSSPAFPVEFANSAYQLLDVKTFPGTIEYYEIITGLEQKIPEILIYPNPFIDEIYISNEKKDIRSIKVFDHTGTLVTALVDPDNSLIEIPLNGNSAGIYFVQLKKINQIFTKKLVKSLFP